MIRCKMCGRVTNPREPTGKIFTKRTEEIKGRTHTFITGEQDVCHDCM